MANVSFSLTRGEVDVSPDEIAVGTQAPAAGDVELRISTTNVPNRQDVIVLVEAFLRRLNDGRYNDLTSV